jgi:hypothetical protein
MFEPTDGDAHDVYHVYDVCAHDFHKLRALAWRVFLTADTCDDEDFDQLVRLFIDGANHVLCDIFDIDANGLMVFVELSQLYFALARLVVHREPAATKEILRSLFTQEWNRSHFVIGKIQRCTLFHADWRKILKVLLGVEVIPTDLWVLGNMIECAIEL